MLFRLSKNQRNPKKCITVSTKHYITQLFSTLIIRHKPDPKLLNCSTVCVIKILNVTITSWSSKALQLLIVELKMH